jgi:purine-binding chemotaxis protein CheW
VKELVTFRVGASRYALPAEQVVEAIDIEAVSHQVLSGHDDGLGLTRVRGHWVPVVELSRAIPDAEPLDRSADAVLLLLGHGRNRLGLRVQELGEVVEADENRARVGSDSEGLLELNGELVRYVDPGLLLNSRTDLLGEEGGAMEENRATAESRQLVTFRLGEDEFAIDVMRALEVLKTREVRSVPKAPDFVEGLVTVRDTVVPVIDMRKRFSLISQAPDFFRGLAGRYLEGIARDSERLVILLNLDEILTSKEKIALEKLIEKVKGEDSGGKPKPARSKKRGTRRKKSGGS